MLDWTISLNKHRTLKTLIYKGFGMDKNGEVSYQIKLDQSDPKTPIVVSVRSSDQQFSLSINDFDEDRYDCFSYSTIYGEDDSRSDLFLIEQYSVFEKDEDMREDKLFSHAELYLKRNRFESLNSAIDWIKNDVVRIREYWKKRILDYNKLVVELRELSIEAFIDETVGDTITLSETRKLK
jgi:hypothetical protein